MPNIFLKDEHFNTLNLLQKRLLEFDVTQPCKLDGKEYVCRVVQLHDNIGKVFLDE